MALEIQQGIAKGGFPHPSSAISGGLAGQLSLVYPIGASAVSGSQGAVMIREPSGEKEAATTAPKCLSSRWLQVPSTVQTLGAA